MKKYLLLLITLLSMGLVLWLADLEKVYGALKQVDYRIVILACIMQLLTIFLITFQWYSIGRQMGEKLSFIQLFHVNMAGTFVESVTPSVKAGGEATKVYMLINRLGLSGGKAAAMVGLQKTVSMAAFLMLNFVSMLWFMLTIGFKGFYGKLLLGSFVVLCLFLILLVLLLLYPHRIQSIIGRFLKAEKRKRLQKLTEQFITSVKEALRQRNVVGRQLLFALFIWFFYAFKAYFISRGLNLPISFVAITVITYLTYMVAMIPLLPGGLGTFEGSMSFLLTPFQIPLYQGMAMAIILRFVTFWFVFLVSGLYFALFTLFNGRRGAVNKI